MRKVILFFVLIVNLYAEAGFAPAIYKEVVLNNAEAALEDANAMVRAIEKGEALEPPFKQLVLSWKRVETLYIAGELDEDAIDLPRYIDIFHNGNENIYEQLDRIVASNDDVAVALFKNSNKSINALEYMVVKKQADSERERAMAMVMAGHIVSTLDEILEIYKQGEEAFVSNEQEVNAVLINTLIESSYKLKEWRVGDAAGLSRKYRGRPDNSRAEYVLSGLSSEAIKTILLQHKEVMDSDRFKDFGDMALESGAEDEVKMVRKSIDAALANVAKVGNDFSSPAAKQLYKDLARLHSAYYISLIGALKVSSKILDADGD